MLKICNLYIDTQQINILKGLDLDVQESEIHIIMGPNGVGKSTLVNVLAGKVGYDIIKGTVFFGTDDLMSLNVEDRVKRGLFLSFQHPIEIPGVSWESFLKNYQHVHRNYRIN